MNSRCIIFDLDGTLVDSESLSNKALLDLLPEVDESLEKLTDRYQGEKLVEIFIDIEERFKFSIPEGFEPIYREHVAELFEKELKPVPGAIEMLNQPKWLFFISPRNQSRQTEKLIVFLMIWLIFHYY